MNSEIRIMRITSASGTRFQWHLLEGNGLRRVASGECDSRQDAAAAAEKARKTWIIGKLEAAGVQDPAGLFAGN